ncbi:hypothetical protein Hypma_005487 [Hypsizygus marmoreus]|uniref:Uncharacterized protein n=1 Tax=Hypsizygus marmoreus TaxID=39966 RepID=A0A369J847_HYPMA|nr:hypothetical protein Hypma_005487 [Hypsizygus marmoreus]
MSRAETQIQVPSPLSLVPPPSPPLIAPRFPSRILAFPGVRIHVHSRAQLLPEDGFPLQTPCPPLFPSVARTLAS